MSEPTMQEIIYWNERLRMEREYHEARMAQFKEPERIAELEVAVAQQAINMVELASFKETVVALAHHWDSSGQFDELVEIIQAHKE